MRKEHVPASQGGESAEGNTILGVAIGERYRIDSVALSVYLSARSAARADPVWHGCSGFAGRIGNHDLLYIGRGCRAPGKREASTASSISGRTDQHPHHRSTRPQDGQQLAVGDDDP